MHKNSSRMEKKIALRELKLRRLVHNTLQLLEVVSVEFKLKTNEKMKKEF